MNSISACVIFVCLVPLLSGCGGPEIVPRDEGLTPLEGALLPSFGPGLSAGRGGGDEPWVRDHEPELPDDGTEPSDTPPPATRATPEPEHSASQSDTGAGNAGSDGSAASADPIISEAADAAETTPGSWRLADGPRNNPNAADLLDHWGHRQRHRIAAGLSLAEPAAGDNAADLRSFRTAAQADGEALVAPDLQDGDEVEVLGAHRGVTYGRWTGGAADTLSIEFDISRAGPEMRGDPAFRAALERAGKAWSRRIDDTWTPWERRAGEHKGWLINGTDDSIEVHVGEGGEISTGLEIDVVDEDLPEDTAGWANTGGAQPSSDAWEPRFGSMEIDRTHLQEAGEAALFATLTHEIGHVLGVWMGDLDGHDSHTDTAAGAWTGPSVVAVHGGPAPFQDASVTRARVGAEDYSLDSQYDFAHSGVCISVMAYCNGDEAVPAFLPHAIDFAFLADLGLTIAEETDRPETYGLAGWTEYAAFTLSLSRELEIALADPQPHYDGWVSWWQKLDVVDLLHAGVDVFGHRTVAAHAENLSDTARYAGRLIGTALDRFGLPPVTGNASLALDLGTLDGTASFTSLLVYPDGIPETFAGGSFYYPFGLSDNAIIGTGAGLTLHADFYGPAHEEVAGVLHDPRVGLLGSFGATTDDRPTREDLIATADYMLGQVYWRGSAAEGDYGWHDYRCETRSECESIHWESGSWTEWTATPREQALAATAAWAWQDTSRLVRDRGFVRITRQTSSDTDGGQGRYAVDAYSATLSHVAFGVGFEHYTTDWAGSDGTPPGSGNRWQGFQGSLARSLPDGNARWSGPMLGYQEVHEAGDNPFVEGLATVKFSLSDNQVDVLISEVMSLDQQRTVDDFSFEDLPAEADGTFEGFRSGSIRGGFFGPSQQEAAGWFYHNPTRIAGSFGARRLPDTVTLEETGTFNVLESSDGSHLYAFDTWGFWARQFDENVFGVFIEPKIREVNQITYYDSTFGRIDGTPSGSNPVSGTAVWSGKVRAFDTLSVARWTPVSGNARLAVDFRDATVDVDFTDFEAGHSDMSWRSLRLRGGAFRGAPGLATIEGAFYGAEHQGVAGKFNRDGLQGVFGAVRN